MQPRCLLPIFLLSASALVLPVSAVWPFGAKKETPTEVRASDEQAAAAMAVPRSAIEFGGNVVTNKNGQFTLRPHLRFADEKSELEFRSFLSSRVRAMEDLIVLRRLQDEKIQEIARFEEQLKEDFTVDARANYEYDADKGEIILLTRITNAVDAGGAASTNAVALKRSTHRKLGDKAQQERFLRLVAAKQLSMEQIQSLEMLRNEKTMEVKLIQENMNRKFSTSTDRDYRYDRDTKTLYELVPVPGSVPAASAAVGKQEAVRK